MEREGTGTDRAREEEEQREEEELSYILKRINLPLVLFTIQILLFTAMASLLTTAGGNVCSSNHYEI